MNLKQKTHSLIKKTLLLVCLAIVLTSHTALAGNIFITGHDPMWHSEGNSSSPGFGRMVKAIMDYTQNGNTLPVLVIESIQGGRSMTRALTLEGYAVGTAGVDPGLNNFVWKDAAALAAMTQADWDNLASDYSVLATASDFGGEYSNAENIVLLAHKPEIAAFVNAGGGLYAGSQNGRLGIPVADRFGHLPVAVSSQGNASPPYEATPEGQAIGMFTVDFNACCSHSNFGFETFGLTVATRSVSTGQVMSLFGSVNIIVDAGGGTGDFDNDGDGLGNTEETTVYFTDPNNPDSDGDEVAAGTDPTDPTSGGLNANKLDHFKCYKSKGDSANTLVDLEDVFGTESDVMVEKPKLFCNPVIKTHDGEVTEIADDTAHLTGYRLKNLHDDKDDEDESIKRRVTLNNQFGDGQTMIVKKPEYIFVPSEKNGVSSDLNLDHFTCYKAQGNRTNQSVDLEDQFVMELGVKVKEPRLFCNPVKKTHYIEVLDISDPAIEVTEISNPDAQLVCYKIKGDKQKLDVDVNNQFGLQIVDIKRPRLLCVPSEMISFETVVDDDEDDKDDKDNDKDDEDDKEDDD